MVQSVFSTNFRKKIGPRTYDTSSLVLCHKDCMHCIIIFRTNVKPHMLRSLLSVCLSALRMELWPGYVSSIAQYDGGLMLMFDVSHRLLRTDSALDFLLVILMVN